MTRGSGQQPLFPLEGEAAPAVPPRLQAWDPDGWEAGAGWQSVVDRFLVSPDGLRLAGFVRDRLAQGAVVYPPAPFRALALTPLADVRVVILGQDPYHGPGQAQGLAFSVAEGVRLPPSLRNIYKELQREGLLGAWMPGTFPAGDLQRWARQGVLLLNTCLTVEEGQPASHANRGWEHLTDALLAQVASTVPACVYMLWGSHAQAKAGLVERLAAQHGKAALVLQANHPSPLSALRPPRPFIGCGHFSAARQWLAERGVALDWEM